jgi:hypothetical protein
MIELKKYIKPIRKITLHLKITPITRIIPLEIKMIINLIIRNKAQLHKIIRNYHIILIETVQEK